MTPRQSGPPESRLEPCVRRTSRAADQERKPSDSTSPKSDITGRLHESRPAVEVGGSEAQKRQHRTLAPRREPDILAKAVEGPLPTPS